MSRQSFKDSPEVSEQTSRSLNTSIKNKAKRIDQLEANINVFIAAVASVQFNVDTADAEPWMTNWEANLLSGDLTVPEDTAEL